MFANAQWAKRCSAGIVLGRGFYLQQKIKTQLTNKTGCSKSTIEITPKYNVEQNATNRIKWKNQKIINQMSSSHQRPRSIDSFYLYGFKHIWHIDNSQFLIIHFLFFLKCSGNFSKWYEWMNLLNNRQPLSFIHKLLWTLLFYNIVLPEYESHITCNLLNCLWVNLSDIEIFEIEVGFKKMILQSYKRKQSLLKAW